MRLLFVGTGRGGGGTESHFVVIASAMAEAGHEVAAVVRPGEFMYRELAGSGRIPLYDGAFERSNDPSGAAAVWRSARDFRPDWLVASFKREYLAVGLVARSLRIRAAFFKHIVNIKPAGLRLLPRLADRFIVPSVYLRDRLVQRGAPAGRIQVLPNPVDVSLFAPDPRLRERMRRELGVAEDEVLVGFVGRMVAAKGVHPYFEALEAAMARTSRLRALWVGDGEAASGILERLWRSPWRERHAHVGWVADVRPCYAAMDLLAFPSIGPETFGRACVEAEAFGVPVLASRTGGVPETLTDGDTGVLLPPGDIRAWSDALTCLADDAAARAHMGRNARRLVEERFCHRRIAAQFQDLLQQSP